jgi:hypothetical protein
MNIDQKEIELKEIPTPRELRKPVPVTVDVGSSEFFEVLASANNKIIEIIELNDPAKLKSFSIFSNIEDSLDIIGPMLIKSYKEKGWRLSIVKEPKRAARKGMPDFDGEHAACSMAEIDTRSLPAKFLDINFSDFFVNALAILFTVALLGVPICCSVWIFLEYGIAPEIDMTSQLIKVSGAEATLEDADGNMSKMAVGASEAFSEENIGKCLRHIDKTNKFGRKEWSVVDCGSTGLVEYGENDGRFGELFSVEREGNRSKVEFKDRYGSLVVDEPSYNVLRQKTGNEFRYNDFRADGGVRKLTKINRKN